MFWERVHYALILMSELAKGCRENGAELSSLAEKYDLPISSFNSVLEQLEQAGYIVHRGGSLFLQIEPDKISIWDIIESIDKTQRFELTELMPEKQLSGTSTAIMVDKEIVLKMIRFKFQRHKLSACSEKSGKMIYIY